MRFLKHYVSENVSVSVILWIETSSTQKIQLSSNVHLMIELDQISEKSLEITKKQTHDHGKRSKYHVYGNTPVKSFN